MGGLDLQVPIADLAVAMPDQSAPDLARPGVCDLGGGEDAAIGLRLWLAAPGTGGELSSTSFTPTNGWTPWVLDSSALITDIALTLYGGHPLAAVRRNDSRLQIAMYEPCIDGLGALADPFTDPFTSHQPGLAGGELVFKGGISNDKRLYYSSFDGATWATPTEQSSLLTTRGPWVTRTSSATHVAFAGTDTKVYDGVVSTSTGGGAATDTGGTSNFTPAAITLDDDTVFIVFTGIDTNLYWTAPNGSGGFLAPKQLCATLSSCLDTSDGNPQAATIAGSAVVAWHGTDGHIYAATLQRDFSTMANSIFSAAVEVSAGDTSNFAPTVAPGLFDASAELVYIRASDGTAMHSRLSTSWSAPAAITGATLAGNPSLASR
jgi:hypothetical protein